MLTSEVILLIEFLSSQSLSSWVLSLLLLYSHVCLADEYT